MQSLIDLSLGVLKSEIIRYLSCWLIIKSLLKIVKFTSKSLTVFPFASYIGIVFKGREKGPKNIPFLRPVHK